MCKGCLPEEREEEEEAGDNEEKKKLKDVSILLLLVVLGFRVHELVLTFSATRASSSDSNHLEVISLCFSDSSCL